MIKTTLFKNIVATLVCVAVISAVFAMPVSAATEPGTAAPSAAVRTASAGPTPTIASSTSLSPVVTETGKISLSVDGLGTTGTGIIQVDKPEGATVKAAYMAGASLWSAVPIADGQVKIDGQNVNWDYFVHKYTYNHWADVTSLVKEKIDAAPAGTIDFTITEDKSFNIDGTVLVVIFDDPNQVDDNTIVLLFGAQSTDGDTFNLLLADPIDKSVPDMSFDMGLGISFSYQSDSDQYSIVDVNGQRLTSAAGGEDDGESSDGELLTVGGLGDSNKNPADPDATAYSDPRQDDELYDILPFVNDGDNTITVYTENPSDDDNIFFAYFNLKSTTAIVGEGILLSPSSATATVGDSYTVTATVQDDSGNPVESKRVNINVKSGPHAGYDYAGITDTNGQVSFTYTGTAAGTDVIKASFIDSQEVVITSNEVNCVWEESGNNNNNNEIPEFPTIALPIAAIIGLAFVFHSRKEE